MKGYLRRVVFAAALGGISCSVYDEALLDKGTAIAPDGGDPNEMDPPPGQQLSAECSDMILSEGETDVDCGGDECGPCVVGGRCLQDQDCAQPPAGSFAVSTCENGTCEMSCEGVHLDCNGEFLDGCESNPLSDPMRCGGCLETDEQKGVGVSCEARDNATTLCLEQECSWSCKSGWGDLDDDLLEDSSNGCEQEVLRCAAPFDTKPRYVVGAVVSLNGFNWECLVGECIDDDCTPGATTCPWGKDHGGHGWKELGPCVDF